MHRMRRQRPNLVGLSICIVVCWVRLEGRELKTFSAKFDHFDDKSMEILEFTGSASISLGSLQLAPDVHGRSSMVSPSTSGRVLLKQPFKLWEQGPAINGSASFNTSFLFNIFRVRGGVPQGLAFVIAPDLHLPDKSSGPYLGLTSPENDGREGNKLVAVEFDTFKDDDFDDPDSNHVGIDVNSVRSIKTESLTRHNITINSTGANFYNAWVEFDGVNRVINVFLAEQADMEGATPPKPASPVLSAPLNLAHHLYKYSYFGFSASTGYGDTLNAVVKWNLTVQHFFDPGIQMETESKSRTRARKFQMVMAVSGLVLGLLGVAGMGYWYYKYKTASSASTSNLVRTLKCLPGMPREFTIRELNKATHNFDNKNKLGQGGFGVVYRGMLVKDKTEIAVKLFSRENIKGQLDFIAELTVINRLRHKHLVKLLGWCSKNGKLLLVYEYMPNSSLDQHLFVSPNQPPLPWNLRLKILTGVASALHYLHNEYDHRVIHRDLKASNIMLDNDFNPRLGDFGLARVLDNEKTSYTEAKGAPGTMGYIAPECLLTGKATRQSDIYAFGAVLLEVVCGQHPGARIGGFNFLVDWVWMLHRDGRLVEAVDERLGGEYVAEEARLLLLLGLACSHPDSSDRPKTEDVVKIISGTMPAPAVPPFKPAFHLAADVAVAEHEADGEVDEGSINTMSITVADLVR